MLLRRENQPMSEKELIDSFSVSDRHPLYRAVLQMTEEALDAARSQALSPAMAREYGQLAYYSGASAHLEMLRDAFARLQILATSPELEP